eukprot:5568254-Alexandrium_andersonii.AAC.1
MKFKAKKVKQMHLLEPVMLEESIEHEAPVNKVRTLPGPADPTPEKRERAARADARPYSATGA